MPPLTRNWRITASSKAQGHVRLIRTATELDALWDLQRCDTTPPLGVILSMEGADPIVTPAQAEEWWEAGLRAVGLAHYGRGQYAYGTGVSGPLSTTAFELLREFERLGMILDVTHLCDQSMRRRSTDSAAACWPAITTAGHWCRAIGN